MNRVKVSENFSLHEFECRCCGQVKLERELLTRLQEMRNYLDAPLIITSGYRCLQHNTKVGGAPKSQHMMGRAADISLANHNMSPDEMADVAEKMGFSGIGIYQSAMVHVDTRGTPARWDWR